MCTALVAITTFTYLATWSIIIYYIVNRNIQHYRHVIIPIIFIIINTIFVNIHIHSTCHVGHVKTGAATLAVLIFVLAINVSDFCSAKCVHTGDSTGDSTGNTRSARSTRADQQEA